MTQTGVDHKKRGANIMKTGLGMLVFGVAIALAFGYEQEPNAMTGWAALVAIAGFITAIVGIGKWRERPAGD
jgi:uncharacterized membrane protein YidH (DUF202 family)